MRAGAKPPMSGVVTDRIAEALGTLSKAALIDLYTEPGERLGHRQMLATRPPLPAPTQHVDFDAFVADPKPVSALRVRREA